MKPSNAEFQHVNIPKATIAESFIFIRTALIGCVSFQSRIRGLLPPVPVRQQVLYTLSDLPELECVYDHVLGVREAKKNRIG